MDKILPKETASIWKKAAETLPKDEWICDICHEVNTNWMPNMSLILRESKIEFHRGMCENCRRLKDEKIIKEENAMKLEDKKRKIQKLLASSQIPPKVADSTFDKLEIRKGAEKTFKTMKRLENADRWIYVSGTNNTGKTLLIGATINDLSSKNIPCYYFNERSLFRRFKDAMDTKNNESSYSIMRELKSAEIIFWDDFSIFAYSPWEAGMAYDLLEFFDTYYKKIVFFSNFNLEDTLKENANNVETRIGKRPLARMQKNKTHYIHMDNEPFK